MQAVLRRIRPSGSNSHHSTPFAIERKQIKILSRKPLIRAAQEQ
jgi:hypothetical protein